MAWGERLVGLGVLGLAAVFGGFWGQVARADSAGAIAAHGLASAGGRYGLAVMGDFWFVGEQTRFGASTGLGGMSEGNGLRAWVLTPLAMSLSAQPAPGASGMALLLRAGGYAGVHAGGFGAGGFVSGGCAYQRALGNEAGFRVGLSAWWLSGSDQAVWLTPWLGLAY